MHTTLRFLGAARTVTGSATELVAGTSRLLVDCGLFQGDPRLAERNRTSPLDDAHRLGAVVLTHGHLDHVGRLPALVRAGFDGPVVGHPATLDLCELLLRDAQRVAVHEGTGGFDDDDVARVIERFEPLRYGVTRGLLRDVEVCLFDAGHILGSSSVLVRTPDTTVLFSGDLGRAGTPISATRTWSIQRGRAWTTSSSSRPTATAATVHALIHPPPTLGGDVRIWRKCS